MGLELTTDRYPPITSQTCYPLHHAASLTYIHTYIPLNNDATTNIYQGVDDAAVRQ